jgi:hypothetical protein
MQKEAREILKVRFKWAVLDYAQGIGSVTKACCEFEVPRSTFYNWKRDPETAYSHIPRCYSRRVYFKQGFIFLGRGFFHLCELKNFRRSVLFAYNRFHRCSSILVKSFKLQFTVNNPKILLNLVANIQHAIY